MANSTKIGTRSIEITGLDADWYWNVELVGHSAIDKLIRKIAFYPSLATDRFIIREGSIDGATIFDTGIVTDTGARVDPHRKPLNMPLVIDISGCTLDTAASAKVVIWIE